MSKQAKTYIVLLLVIAVLAVAKIKLGKKPEESALFRFPANRIAKIQIQRPDEKLLQLERRSDEWYIAQPIRALATAEDVDRIAESIAGLKLRSDYRDEKDTKASERGLDKPTVAVQAWSKKGKQLADIKIGDETPAGGERWCLVGGKLCTVSSYVKTDFEKDPEHLRDKKLARFEKDDVQRVELKYGKTHIVCVREPKENEPEIETWNIKKPILTGADDFQVDSMIGAVRDLKTEGFVESKNKSLKDFGLDKPATTVTLSFKKKAKRAPITLQFGAQAKKSVALGKAAAGGAEDEMVAYAKRVGRDEILCVPVTKLDEVQQGLKQLRDRTIWDVDTDFIEKFIVKRPAGNNFTLARTSDDEWQVIDPKPAKVDQGKMDSLLWAFEDLRAEDFVEDAPKNLARYGLDKPRGEVRLVMSKGKDKVLYIGKPRGTDVYVKTADSPSVYTIREFAVKKLPTVLSDIAKTPEPKKEETKGTEGQSEEKKPGETPKSTEKKT